MSYRQSKPKPHSKQLLMIPKGENMELRFGYSDYGEIDRLDIRQWVRAENTGNMIPTKSGLSIPLAELDQFLNALTRVVPQVRKYSMEYNITVKKPAVQTELDFTGVSSMDPVDTDLKPEDLKGDDTWGN